MSAEEIARVCHEANRALQLVDGDPAPSRPWDDAPTWQRESAVAGVRNALAETHDPAAHHQAWVDAKAADGWTYGTTKDPEARTHPCMLPYDDLPANQRRKDVLFLSIVNSLTQ
ncbi:hypothetical protein G1H11_14045 [Phytoactinopolyspora alkaliphila]|uniref:Ryanodine receptor Ryr domain-containing protein n=1 Tax=Phytoactinopolyspora alkaliphila TaxID=1783498 RepID=A0A6N9YNA2_9ACTN|nr:hypothetical protein [Phytoactinopolyspora alkaliphila]